MTTPMLAEFVLRLAGGLAALLLLTPWRLVPPAFFRTHCQIILALLVLAGLDLWRTSPDRLAIALTIGSAVLAYSSSIAWGLGLPRLGIPLTASIVAAVGLILLGTSPPSPLPLWLLNASGRLASAALLGSTLTAMLLGHHYLTAPAMSIDPLRRFVRSMAAALSARATLAALGLWFWLSGQTLGTGQAGEFSYLFLAMRWVVGLAGTAIATYLAWRTVEIRSTQSATGILYVGMTLVLFGELTALTLSRQAGVIL